MLIIKHLKYTKSSLPHPRNTITTVIPAKSQIAKAKSPSKILVTCKIWEFSIFERLCRFVKVL